MRNAQYNWESFGQQIYVKNNYDDALPPDEIILEQLTEFYAVAPLDGQHIEIGAGPNLYPLMAAAKYRDRILVTDIAASNLAYIQAQIDSGLSDLWKRWHSRLQQHHGGYDTDSEMVSRLRDVCTYERVSVLDLPEGCYDSCSMMFVAESMTDEFDEFACALRRAVRCVRPGGSFAIALMLNSQGYNAGETVFPAVPVTTDDAKTVIDPEASGVSYREIDFNVREGHEGMLLATGHRKQADASLRLGA